MATLYLAIPCTGGVPLIIVRPHDVRTLPSHAPLFYGSLAWQCPWVYKCEGCRPGTRLCKMTQWSFLTASRPVYNAGESALSMEQLAVWHATATRHLRAAGGDSAVASRTMFSSGQAMSLMSHSTGSRHRINACFPSAAIPAQTKYEAARMAIREFWVEQAAAALVQVTHYRYWQVGGLQNRTVAGGLIYD